MRKMATEPIHQTPQKSSHKNKTSQHSKTSYFPFLNITSTQFRPATQILSPSLAGPNLALDCTFHISKRLPMGNSNKLCGKREDEPTLAAEVECIVEKQRTFELRTCRTVEKILLKPQFHYMRPIEVTHEDLNSQVMTQASQAKEESLKLISVVCSDDPKDKFLSLEEILLLEEEKLEKNRIGVNWNSFIKIKKKNYLEDYVFIKEIGRGAYGSVQKIKMKYGGLFRAAKVIKSALLNADKANTGKLFAEISVPIKLDHPNLVKLYEVFEWRAQYILVMELCEGGDLFNNIKQSRFFTENKAGQVMKQILSAVNYMHKQKVTHRDLKPENILVDSQSDTLKIADFGSATFYSQNQKLSEFVGTPYYMAPEVIDQDYNQKCDVWSCGVILYILLCGSPPFNGKNEQQIMEKIKLKPLEFKNPIWNKRNKHAKDLITRMLNKNPDERPSAEEALNSKWLANISQTEQKGKIGQAQTEVIKNLKSFHFKNKLKAVVYTYIASQLYSNKDKDNLLRVFRQIDKDGDGVIGKEELVSVFNSHSTSSLTVTEIEKILQLVDTNGSGMVDFTEFLVAASNEEKMLQEKRLENAFNYLDADHSGYITIEQVKAFLDCSDETNDQIKQIFNEVDENGDGNISKKEFIHLLLKKD